MALTNEQLVQQMYIAYYQRPADPDGLQYWVDQIATNGSWEAVAAAFGAPENAEYQALYGDMGRVELVASLYQSAFGRNAAQEEIDFWVASEHIDQNLAFAIIAGAQNQDLAVVSKKVEFAELLVAEVDQETYLGLADVKAAIAAVDAETNVADAVAGLVAEGSELAGLLAGVTAAENAKAAFLKAVGEAQELEGADGKLRSATDAEVNGAPAAAAAVLAANDFAGDANFNADDSATLTASKLNTAKLNAAEAVAEAQENVDDANEAAAKVAGLLAANAQVEARAEAVGTAQEALDAADAALAGANAAYSNRFEDGPAAVDFDEDGNPVINPAIVSGTNEVQKAEAAKVLAATVAQLSATAAAAAAAASLEDAQNNLAFIDTAKGEKDALFDELNPTSESTAAGRGDALTWAEAKAAVAVAEGKALAEEEGAAAALAELQGLVAGVLDTDNARINALNEALGENGLKGAQEDQKELLDLIADYEDAVSAAAQLGTLNKAITDANKAVEDAGYDVVAVDSAAHAATAADDVFIVGDTDSAIYNFGLEGDDQLFIGTGFTVNSGTLKNGDDKLLEVFFIQEATGTKVVIEEKAYGTSEDLLTEITLAGVSAADLALSDEGFIAVA